MTPHKCRAQQREIFPCKFCGENLETRLKLMNHYVGIHKLDKDSLNFGKLDNFEECPFCKKVFHGGNFERFVHHVKQDHFAEKDNPIYIEFINEKEEKITCDQCGEVFTNRSNMTKHIIRTHKQFTNPESCEICGKIFNSQLTLKTHYKTHQDNGALCIMCGVSFNSNQSLKRHMDVEHGEGYSCPDCGKKFTVKSRLALHIKVDHLGEKEHCPKCNKSFRLRREVKKHILTVHDQLKPWFCDHCPFRCARYGNLTIHKQKSHQIKNLPLQDFLQMIKDGKHPNCVKMEIDPDLWSLLG